MINKIAEMKAIRREMPGTSLKEAECLFYERFPNYDAERAAANPRTEAQQQALREFTTSVLAGPVRALRQALADDILSEIKDERWRAEIRADLVALADDIHTYVQALERAEQADRQN